MLKLTVAVLAVALAGTASAGWRSMRLEANDEASFTKSLAMFTAKLSPARRVVFGEALKDIWLKGTLAAEAVQREYTASDYYRQIDGLGYDEIVRLVDPTGDTAKARYRAAAVSTRAATPVGPKRSADTPHLWSLRAPALTGRMGTRSAGPTGSTAEGGDTSFGGFRAREPETASQFRVTRLVVVEVAGQQRHVRGRIKAVVPRRGLEPPRVLPHWHLKPARLPIPPPGHEAARRARNVLTASGAVKRARAAARRERAVARSAKMPPMIQSDRFSRREATR